MQRFNASAEQVAEMRRRMGVPEVPHVWPQHWHAAQVFAGMSTQWRTELGRGGLVYLGLDYGALAPVLAEHEATAHVQPMRVLMPQLRTMEGAAMEALNRS